MKNSLKYLTFENISSDPKGFKMLLLKLVEINSKIDLTTLNCKLNLQSVIYQHIALCTINYYFHYELHWWSTQEKYTDIFFLNVDSMISKKSPLGENSLNQHRPPWHS